MLTTFLIYWLAIPLACGLIAMLFSSAVRQMMAEFILPLFLESWGIGIIIWGLIFGGYKLARWFFY